MKRLLAVAIVLLFVGTAFAGTKLWRIEKTFNLSADETETQTVLLPSNGVKVIKLWGALQQDGAGTSFSVAIYSEESTDNDKLVYPTTNSTSEYIMDDTPFYITVTGSTQNTAYMTISNGGSADTLDINLLVKPYPLRLTK